MQVRLRHECQNINRNSSLANRGNVTNRGAGRASSTGDRIFAVAKCAGAGDPFSRPASRNGAIVLLEAACSGDRDQGAGRSRGSKRIGCIPGVSGNARRPDAEGRPSRTGSGDDCSRAGRCRARYHGACLAGLSPSGSTTNFNASSRPDTSPRDAGLESASTDLESLATMQSLGAAIAILRGKCTTFLFPRMAAERSDSAQTVWSRISHSDRGENRCGIAWINRTIDNSVQNMPNAGVDSRDVGRCPFP
jgi:hypothetical protein